MAIDIRINGTANMGQVSKELQKVQAQTALLSKNYREANAAIGRASGPEAQISNYRQWNVQMGQVRDSMIAAARAQGDFQTSSMKVSKQVDVLTDRIQKQQVGFREARREAKALGEVYKHQLALQQSTAVTWGQTMAGSSQVDLFTPNLNKQSAGIDNARKKMGFYGEVLGSVAKQTVNWGKNTQWAGRQLMAGITYPMTIAAGVAAKYAYDIDKGLTQIVKVYGDSGEAVAETDEQIRKSAMNTAKYLTQFGQSATDTLEIQSQLASTGKTGKELQDATEQVTKARLLGELDIQDAMKASITMQEVYGFSAEKLGEKFNYMNAMENQTSLTMQDFVEGIPKVSGIMNSLGADFEDTGVLLAAMKTAGIDAKEGGNAIKSMVFKDIAPSSKALKTFSEATGESLTAIVDKTKGDPITTLQGIGAAMEGLPGEEKVAIIKEVFGIHQGSKALGMIESLTERTGQMGKAFEIANMSVSETGSIAQKELQDLRAADWVKTKKVIEDAKLALADFGKGVLTELVPALEMVVGGLSKAAEWFQNLGSTNKKVVLWTGLIAAMAGPAIMMFGLFGNLAGQAMTFGAAIFKAVGNMKLYTSVQKAVELSQAGAYKSVSSLTAANMGLANSFDVLQRKAYHNLSPAGTSATVGSLAAMNASKSPSSVSAGSMSLAMAGAGAGTAVRGPLGVPVGTTARPGGIPVNSAAVENSKKILDNTRKTQRSWDGIGSKMTNSAMAAGMLGTVATDSESAVNNISNILLTAALIGPALKPVGGILKGAFAGSAVTGSIAKMGASIKNAIVANTAAALLTFDRRVLQSAKKAKASLGGALATGGVAGAATGGAAKGATLKGAGSGILGMLAATKTPLAIAAVGVAAYYYAFHKGSKEAKARQDALNNSIESTGTLLGLATDEMEAFKTGSKENTASQYQDLAKKLKKDNKDLADGIKEMGSGNKSIERAIQQGILHGQEGMVRYGWNKEEAMEAARVYATAINSEVAYNIDKEITVDPFVNVGQVKVNQIDRISRAIQQASKGGVINNDEDSSWFKRNSSQTDEHGVSHGPVVESTKLTGAGKDEIKKNAKAAWDVFKQTQGEERKKAFQQIGSSMYSGLDDVYSDLSKKQKEALKKKGVVDTHTFAQYAEKNGPQAVVDYLEREGVEMSSKSQTKMSESLQVVNEFIVQMLMKSRGKTRKEIEAIYGEDLFDVNILTKTKGFKGSGKLDPSWEQNKLTMVDFRKEMKLAKAARAALTEEQKGAALADYQAEYGMIEGLIRYNHELQRAKVSRQDLTTEELKAQFAESFKGKGKSVTGIIAGMEEFADKTQIATKKTAELGSAEELSRLNEKRRAAGLLETTNIQDGMSKKVSVSAAKIGVETGQILKNTKARRDNASATASWKAPKDIFAGGVDQEFRINNPSKEEAEAAVGKYKDVMTNVRDEMFEEISNNLEKHHEGNMDAIERNAEMRSKRLDAEQERKEAEFDKRQEAIDKAFEAKERAFDAKWDKTMESFDKKWDNANEKFDKRWDNTMESFDNRWDKKTEGFESKWDKTMERFEKSSEKAKEAVEKQYDSRIKRIEKAIEAEQKAEEIRQKIFEKEKARIQHLADMANRTIDINVAVNTGNLDEAARLSNDAQAAIDTYEIGDASEDSQSASDKKISGLENRKERVQTQKDAAIKRVEARIEAERKALEESRKIAQKAMEVSRNKERKMLEAQRDRERKSLDAQREQQRKSLESQRASEQRKLQAQREATGKRLERERQIYAKELQARRDADAKTTESKRKGEQRKYEAAKRAMEKEMEALRGFVPRNQKELKAHIRKVEKSMGSYGVRLEKKGGEWSKSIGNSLEYWTRVARNEMSGDKGWDTLGKSIANRMTKGAFNKSVGEFMKWVDGGGGGSWSSASSGSKSSGSKGRSRSHVADGPSGQGGITRHKGGVIDSSKGSRAGFSGKNLSQSEVNVTALKGESILNRRATNTLGKSGVDALNKGAIPKGHDSRARAIHDDVTKQRGDAPVGIAGIGGMFAAKITQMAMGKGIKEKGEEKQAEEQAMMDDWSSGSFGGSQLQNAATIANVGRSLGASPRDIVIALMTAIVESGLKNVPYGDRDSLGLFQQRAAWGSAAARMNPAKSARMFFLGGAQGQEGLFDKKNRSSRGLGELAQAVQVSAFPERYAQQEGAARAILKSLKWGKGGFNPPSSLSYGGRTFGGGTDVPAGGGGGNVWPGMGFRKMFAIVKRRFPNRAYPDPGQLNQGGHARNSYHYKGRAVDLGSAKANGTPMSTLFNWLYRTYGRQSTQIIYGPAASRNILNGKHFNYGAATNAAHMGHIHWAMKNGGIVPGSGSGDKTPIMGEPGEFMVRKKVVDKVGPDFLKALNSDRFVNMPNAPVSLSASAGVPSGNIDKSYSPTYNVKVDARGASSDVDVYSAVKDALTDIERRKGFDRKIGG